MKLSYTHASIESIYPDDPEILDSHGYSHNDVNEEIRNELVSRYQKELEALQHYLDKPDSRLLPLLYRLSEGMKRYYTFEETTPAYVAIPADQPSPLLSAVRSVLNPGFTRDVGNQVNYSNPTAMTFSLIRPQTGKGEEIVIRTEVARRNYGLHCLIVTAEIASLLYEPIAEEELLYYPTKGEVIVFPEQPLFLTVVDYNPGRAFPRR